MTELQPPRIAEKRNAPIWQVFAVVFVLMGLSAGSFYYGYQNSDAPSSYQSDYGTDYGTDSGTDTSGEYSDPGNWDTGSQVQTYILNNFIGYGSTSVERTLRSAGFFVYVRYTNGDPSLSARLNDGCVVVDQSPVGGSEVFAGSSVTILADCPLTGNW
jgi:hypothetical protein